jgi:hypothetical protein
MEHVVFFPAPDGSPAFRRVPTLEDAVRFVEHLRNSEGVDHVSVHSLTDVPLAFKAYYRVEVPQGDEAPSSSTGLTNELPQPSAEQTAVPALVPEQEQPAATSLGFFAS